MVIVSLSRSFIVAVKPRQGIHSKSEKVCGTAFSVKEILRKSGRHFWAISGNFGLFWVIFWLFWIILGHSWDILGHFRSYLGHVGPFLDHFVAFQTT